uniref:F-box protein At2g27310-like n=1 Tax=Erigeron canadensis TaxID=72917 RepID=UPI001CB89965|nr:F-box protein At2g27310-like [Erigeron canadensis]
MATTLEDIHQDIIQKHILPRLDGPSLWTIATATASSSSSYLRSLCSDDDHYKLWTDVSMSTWPSITHPRVHQIISTFPNGYRSFFQDSFPSLFTYSPSYLSYLHQKNKNKTKLTNVKPIPKTNLHQNDHQRMTSCDHHPLSSKLISLVDIRYKGNIIYSKTHFTDTTNDHFLSSPFQIVLNESTHVPKKFDELAPLNDEETLSFLKESMTLNWIIINPTHKRAGNLSTIKPVSVKYGWVSNEINLQYITVLPGCNPKDEMVKCKIQLVLLESNIEGDVILQVKEISLKAQDLVSSNWLNGKDFMVITQRAILEENNVKRSVIDDERRLMSHIQLKQIKKDQKEAKKEEEKKKFVAKFNYAGLMSLLFCYYIYFFLSTSI